MSTNYKTSGRTVRYAHDAAVESGAPVLIGTLLGVARGKYAADETGIYAVEGVHSLPKNNAAIAMGARVYWDISASQVRTSGNAANGDLENCAVAVAAAAAGDSTVDVRLSPGVGTVKS